MPLLAAFVALAWQGPVPEPNFAVFRDLSMNLEFRHPRTWAVLQPPRNRKKNDGETNFRMALNGGGTATLTILRNRFAGTVEEWQALLTTTAQAQKREIVRQSQQELMGSPMLLTRIKYQQGEESMSELAGLFFNGSAVKLQFRLTSTLAASERAEFELNQALETLRIANEKAIVNPNAPAGAPGTPEADQMLDIVKPKRPREFAPMTQELKVSNRKVGLRYPKGWTSTLLSDGTIQLRHPDAPRPVKVTVFWAGDSDPVGRIFSRESGRTLSQFKTVKIRTEAPVKENRAGNLLAISWRVGTDEKGPLSSLDAIIAQDEFFATFSTAIPTASDKKWRQLLSELLDRVSLELRP